MSSKRCLPASSSSSVHDPSPPIYANTTSGVPEGLATFGDLFDVVIILCYGTESCVGQLEAWPSTMRDRVCIADAKELYKAYDQTTIERCTQPPKPCQPRLRRRPQTLRGGPSAPSPRTHESNVPGLGSRLSMAPSDVRRDDPWALHPGGSRGPHPLRLLSATLRGLPLCRWI